MTTTHTPFCWNYAMQQLDENATDAGCTPAGPWGWLATDEVPEWGATAGAIVTEWLADGTATCTCERGA